MAEITRKQICKCTHCGNEAEMVFTCMLGEDPLQDAGQDGPQTAPAPHEKMAVARAVCSHCGNEAEMWIDI